MQLTAFLEANVTNKDIFCLCKHLVRSYNTDVTLFEFFP